jgi:hypothetical protein
MKHLIMDATGHSTIEIDKSNIIDLDAAMKRFAELTGSGHVAATRKAGEADYRVIKDASDQEDETLFVPQMRGG